MYSGVCLGACREDRFLEKLQAALDALLMSSKTGLSGRAMFMQQHHAGDVDVDAGAGHKGHSLMRHNAAEWRALPATEKFKYEAMIDEFDKDGDGMINSDEFAYILKQTSLSAARRKIIIEDMSVVF